jgi:Golgi-resident PAP phosphatase
MDASGNKLNVPAETESKPVIVVSRSHAGKVKDLATKAFGDKYTVEPAGGSGYKTLRVLNGTACGFFTANILIRLRILALYVHTTAIKKWDVCAADALIRSVGGALVDLEGQELDYSHGSDVLNKNGLLVAVHKPFELLQKFKTVL